jgi:hypothetical protein
MLKILVLALCSAFATSVKLKLYTDHRAGAKFSIRCIDGSEPKMGSLNDMSTATVSEIGIINEYPSSFDCTSSYRMCKDCKTRCGTKPNFDTLEPICTHDKSAVLCTGSYCNGVAPLRGIGTAKCPGAMELQVQASKLFVNAPQDVWIWASDKFDVTFYPYGWIWTYGREFSIGSGALVIGQGSEERVGKCCNEEGKTVYGNPMDSCDHNGEGSEVQGSEVEGSEVEGSKVGGGSGGGRLSAATIAGIAMGAVATIIIILAAIAVVAVRKKKEEEENGENEKVTKRDDDDEVVQEVQLASTTSATKKGNLPSSSTANSATSPEKSIQDATDSSAEFGC